MLRNLAITHLLLLAPMMHLVGCSSNSKSPQRVHQKSGDWDYKKIEENIEADKAQGPTTPIFNPQDDALCQPMNRSEMLRAKAQGCRKLDPRLGHGENAYCCPPKK